MQISRREQARDGAGSEESLAGTRLGNESKAGENAYSQRLETARNTEKKLFSNDLGALKQLYMKTA